MGVPGSEESFQTQMQPTHAGSIKERRSRVRQANATVMKSIFWIQELRERNKYGKPKLRLQYSQLVMLDFFPRVDGLPPGCCPDLIQWPHVSINTMEKVVE